MSGRRFGYFLPIKACQRLLLEMMVFNVSAYLKLCLYLGMCVCVRAFVRVCVCLGGAQSIRENGNPVFWSIHEGTKSGLRVVFNAKKYNILAVAVMAFCPSRLCVRGTYTRYSLHDTTLTTSQHQGQVR